MLHKLLHENSGEKCEIFQFSITCWMRWSHAWMLNRMDLQTKVKDVTNDKTELNEQKVKGNKLKVNMYSGIERRKERANERATEKSSHFSICCGCLIGIVSRAGAVCQSGKSSILLHRPNQHNNHKLFVNKEIYLTVLCVLSMLTCSFAHMCASSSRGTVVIRSML